jgi:hypothetical protein
MLDLDLHRPVFLTSPLCSVPHLLPFGQSPKYFIIRELCALACISSLGVGVQNVFHQAFRVCACKYRNSIAFILFPLVTRILSVQKIFNLTGAKYASLLTKLLDYFDEAFPTFAGLVSFTMRDTYGSNSVPSLAMRL